MFALSYPTVCMIILTSRGGGLGGQGGGVSG